MPHPPSRASNPWRTAYLSPSIFVLPHIKTGQPGRLPPYFFSGGDVGWGATIIPDSGRTPSFTTACTP